MTEKNDNVTVPSWTPLRCDDCGERLEPILGCIFILGTDITDEIRDAITRTIEGCESFSYRDIPIIACDSKRVEIERESVHGMLRCTKCGLLYEKVTDK